MNKKIIELRNVSKYYGVNHQKVIFDDINLVFNDEIHAIVGSNGSGKTSLIKILAGVENPNKGKVFGWNYKLQHYSIINDPKLMSQLQMAYSGQEENFLKDLTVRQNITLGLEPTKLLMFPSWKEINYQIHELMNDFKIKINLDKFVRDLAVEEFKKLALLRALFKKPKILLLDEPSIGLSDSQKAEFSVIFEQLRSKKVTVIFTTRDEQFAWAVADKVSYLKTSKITETKIVDESKPKLLFSPEYWNKLINYQKPVVDNDSIPLLYVNDFKFSHKHLPSFYDLQFAVRRGEIYGIYDYENIYSEVLVESLVNLNKANSKKIWFDQADISFYNPAKFAHLNISWLSGSYYQKAVLADENLFNNFAFWNYNKNKYVTKSKIIKKTEIKSKVESILKKYQIAADVNTKASSLSKGELQKFLLARSIEENPRLLILVNPFSDLDQDSSLFIIEQLLDLVARKNSVLLIDTDPYILELLAHRVAVIYQHNFVAKLLGPEIKVANMISSDAWVNFPVTNEKIIKTKFLLKEKTKLSLILAKIKKMVKIIYFPFGFIKNSIIKIIDQFHSRWG